MKVGIDGGSEVIRTFGLILVADAQTAETESGAERSTLGGNKSRADATLMAGMIAGILSGSGGVEWGLENTVERNCGLSSQAVAFFQQGTLHCANL